MGSGLSFFSDAWHFALAHVSIYTLEMSKRSPFPQSTKSCMEHRFGMLDKDLPMYYVVETIWKEINVVGMTPLLQGLGSSSKLLLCRNAVCYRFAVAPAGVLRGWWRGNFKAPMQNWNMAL